GAAQAAALSDFSHAGKTGPPRAPHAAAAGSQLETGFPTGSTHGACYLCPRPAETGRRNHFRLVPPHDGDPLASLLPRKRPALRRQTTSSPLAYSDPFSVAGQASPSAVDCRVPPLTDRLRSRRLRFLERFVW